MTEIYNSLPRPPSKASPAAQPFYNNFLLNKTIKYTALFAGFKILQKHASCKSRASVDCTSCEFQRIIAHCKIELFNCIMHETNRVGFGTKGRCGRLKKKRQLCEDSGSEIEQSDFEIFHFKK